MDLIKSLNRGVAENVLTAAEKKVLKSKELSARLHTVGRHGLNYAQLYQDFEGGYDMEQLKRVLQRVQEDKEDGVHPIVNPA